MSSAKFCSISGGVSSGQAAADAKTIHVYSGWKTPNTSVIGHLRECGYNVEQIVGWRCAANVLTNKEPDLVILDFDFTEPDSFAALVKIRRAFRGPLAVLSERPDEIYHLIVLDLGADDFIGGQVSEMLLAARVKMLLRRGVKIENESEPAVSLGRLVIDVGNREVFLNGRAITLTAVEFDLLLYLGRNAGTVVSRNELYRTILNKEYNGIIRTVDMYISRVRKKLGDDHAAPRMLKTVRGTGYVMSRQVR